MAERKDILIIAHFTSLVGESGNDRFTYIANMLIEDNNEVELVTSSFCHQTKRQRTKKVTEYEPKYKTTLIKEWGYPKNVCLKRLFSHRQMSRELAKYLEQRKKPDVIYCSVPSLDVGYVAALYAKKNNIKLIIDVQDIWPEAFRLVFNVPVISDAVFLHVKKRADFIYSSADEVVAVSNTYLRRAMSVNKKCKNGLSIYLGTDLAYFDQCKKKYYVKRCDNEFWIGYVGTLGSSYDLPLIIDAVAGLKDKGIDSVRLIVMGDGPLRRRFEIMSEEKNIKCDFMGMMDYPHMVGLLCACDVAVNPIRKGAAQSIINKVGDYAAAGLPVINTQNCEEYRKLIENGKCGFNCETKSEVESCIITAMSNPALMEEFSANSRTVAEERFNRAKTYVKIKDAINKTSI